MSPVMIGQKLPNNYENSKILTPPPSRGVLESNNKDNINEIAGVTNDLLSFSDGNTKYKFKYEFEINATPPPFAQDSIPNSVTINPLSTKTTLSPGFTRISMIVFQSNSPNVSNTHHNNHKNSATTMTNNNPELSSGFDSFISSPFPKSPGSDSSFFDDRSVSASGSANSDNNNSNNYLQLQLKSPYNTDQSKKKNNPSNNLKSNSKTITGFDNHLSSSSPPRSEFSNFLDTLSPPQINGRRKKLKSNLSKNNSTFVSFAVLHDSFVKRIAKHEPTNPFIFTNAGKSFQWLELGNEENFDPICKIFFTAFITCHDVNLLTSSNQQIDVMIGFVTGDIIWYEPISNRYSRINKNGIINSSPLVCLKWVPGSENLFLCAYKDGTLILYDKDKEDPKGNILLPQTSFGHGKEKDTANNNNCNNSYNNNNNLKNSIGTGSSFDDYFNNNSAITINKSLSTKSKCNPVASWTITKYPINSFTFSPTGEHIAVVSEEGFLRVLEFKDEKIIDIFSSYFGGLNCVAWSSDGKLIACGGEDDLISIWHVSTGNLIAWCSGHRSFVMDIKFDAWNSNDYSYRLGSLGKDGRLALWDIPCELIRKDKDKSSNKHGHNNNNNIYHPVAVRKNTTIISPIVSHKVDNCPLVSLIFREDSFITTSANSIVRIWTRF